MRSHAFRKTASDRILNAINIGVLSLVLLVVLYPLYFVIIASFSDPNAVYNGQVLFWPKGFVLEGYQRIFSDHIIWRSYFNTAIYTVCGTAIALFLTMSIAFPLSRRYFKGRSVVTILLIIPMYFSGGLIPTYIVVRNLGLLGSPFAVILLGSLSIFNVIITRTFLQGNIPQEMDEAAYIDGASHFRYFASFVLPLSKAIIAVLVLYYGVAYWNDYFTAMIYINTEEWYPLQLRLRELLIASQMLASMEATEDVMYAAYMQRVADLIKYGMIVISTLPVMILYPILQKYFVQGVMIGSLKG